MYRADWVTCSGSGHVVQRQFSSSGMETTSSDGSNDLPCFRRGRGGSLCLRWQLSLPNLFPKATGCSGPQLAQHLLICLFPNRPAYSGGQAEKGNKMLTPPGGPILEKPSLVPRNDSGTVCSSMTDTTKERSSLASVRHDLAPTATAVEPSCLAPRRELTQLPERVTNTIFEARALSTRWLYAPWIVSLPWLMFSTKPGPEFLSRVSCANIFKKSCNYAVGYMCGTA